MGRERGRRVGGGGRGGRQGRWKGEGEKERKVGAERREESRLEGRGGRERERRVGGGRGRRGGEGGWGFSTVRLRKRPGRRTSLVVRDERTLKEG